LQVLIGSEKIIAARRLAEVSDDGAEGVANRLGDQATSTTV
jgi:hypothetical protein